MTGGTVNPLKDQDPMLRHLLQNPSSETLNQKLSSMASAMGDEAFSKYMAREIVDRTRPDKAVPEIYGHYRSLVRDGIAFFLSQVNRGRLIELVVSQLTLAAETSAEERLLELAKCFPTLHKLGQLIARHPHIDPKVKQWLIHLENGRYGTPQDVILAQIHGQLQQAGRLGGVRIQPTILSEASVGAVVPFQWTPPACLHPVDGVLKILKPDIRKHLDEEVTILEKTAAFFEQNRGRYPLRDFKFLEIFQEVRQMLVKEVDLAAEQTHLAEAAIFYGDMAGIQIPQLLPLGTGTMTAMAYLDGPKITDADLNPEQRRHCAAVMFEAIVCRPLFSHREMALFHGDPHAGNILAVAEPASKIPRIGLLDWSLAGRLAKRDRIKTVQLIQAIFKEDLSGIRRSIQALASGVCHENTKQRRQLRDLVLGFTQSAEFERLTLIKKTFRLLEELSYKGYVFAADLMLFRKAIFTLEGVIYDLWPSFDMDAAVIHYLTALMAQEIPERFGNLFFPLADRPENYPSMISNMELQSLMIHQYAAALMSGTQAFFESLGGWCRIIRMPFWPLPAPGPVEARKPNNAGLQSRPVPEPI
jgi:ubiquinone biosynthesis protein